MTTERPPELNAEQVLSLLEERRKARTDHAVAPDRVQSFRQAAAVLAAIERPANLQPLGSNAATGEAERALATDLIPATGRRLGGKVMLEPVMRRSVLRDLASEGKIDAALDTNRSERNGSLQKQLEQYLRGERPPVDGLSLDELDEVSQIVFWLGDAFPGLPSPHELEARAEYRRLLAPFEAIANDEVFRGRRKELDTLRSYIGVLSPESLLRRIADRAFKWNRPDRLPALTLFGPGGVGKSALVARFALEHARLPEEARIPFAYLDFDRAALDVGDPAGIAREMVRQLDVQFSSGGTFTGLRTFAAKVDTVSDDSQLTLDEQIAQARSVLADLLGIIQTALGPRPYVVILDTFEEVQYRGEARANPLWQLLSNLQEQSPFLRVVISGRAPVESLRLGGQAPSRLELGDLDKDAAVAFLQTQGVTDLVLAERLVATFGGVPLSLKLVAELVVEHKEAFADLRELGRQGTFLVSVSDEVIEGLLYDRILGHIRNDQVRRLAHPGLVLRRIDPEVILNVLNKPCDLGLVSIEEANELFDELRRETALVTVDQQDGSLVHRADLRRMMLKFLTQTEPARVTEIRRAAVSWYSSQRSRRAKAEQLYHQLQLGDRVDPQELLDREVRASIQASIVELPVEAQVQLATRGFNVAADVLERASQVEQDSAAASQVEELLPFGRNSREQAADLIRSLTANLDRPSPLYRSAARVAQANGDPKLAGDWIERGIAKSLPAGLTRLTLGLLEEKSWLLRRSPKELPETLRLLSDYAARHRDNAAALQHELQAVTLLTESEANEHLSTLMALLQRVGPDDIWSLTPAFAAAIGVGLRTRDKEFLERLRRVVLTTGSPYLYAGLVDRPSQTALDAVLRESEKGPREFGKAFLELCARWPYELLYVIPSYGSRGDRLTESSAS
jgi:hypothetical protein